MNGDIPWHIFMARHYIYIANIQKLINNMYHNRKSELFSRELCDCKRIWPDRGESRSFYDPEKSDKQVMFIIRHLFCAITCNKLIISVTLVLNYMSNDEAG